MKILLLGAHGQLGVELSKVLPELGELIELSRNELDLSALDELRHLLSLIKPDLIVNASAYTAVDKAETEIEMAFLINAAVPKILAEYAKENNAILVHYSTDYVFDGRKTSPYEENDQPNPLCIYGASKLKGEQNIIISGCKHLTFRTSWLFSAKGQNFLTTILKLAKDKDELRVIDDQWGAPTSCNWLAETTVKALRICLNNYAPPPWGIYHASSNGIFSWFEYARHIVHEATSLDIKLKIKIDRVFPIKSIDYKQSAARPRFSVLSNSKIKNVFLIKNDDSLEYIKKELKNYLDINP